MGQWEWIIILLVVFGLGVGELISVRRSMRRAREEEAGKAPPR